MAGGFEAIGSDGGAPLLLASASPRRNSWPARSASSPKAGSSRCCCRRRRTAGVVRRLAAVSAARPPRGRRAPHAGVRLCRRRPSRSGVREIDQLDRALDEGKATVRQLSRTERRARGGARPRSTGRARAGRNAAAREGGCGLAPHGRSGRRRARAGRSYVAQRPARIPTRRCRRSPSDNRPMRRATRSRARPQQARPCASTLLAR